MSELYVPIAVLTGLVVVVAGALGLWWLWK